MPRLIPGPVATCRISSRGATAGPGISLLLLVVAARPGPQWEETGHCLLAGSTDPVHGQQPCPEGQAASYRRQA